MACNSFRDILHPSHYSSFDDKSVQAVRNMEMIFGDDEFRTFNERYVAAHFSQARQHAHIRRFHYSIYNRLHSIKEDSKFISSLKEIIPLPFFANRRCGSWYVDPEIRAGECYFKSNDGHYGQWAFSLRRSHLMFLKIILEHDKKGAVVVDSTQAGKRFPDSLTKTLPIWACVINRAWKRLFVDKFSDVEENSDTENETDVNPEQWDISLHLPSWIPASEKAAIEERLDTWVNQFQAAAGFTETNLIEADGDWIENDIGIFNGLKLEKPLRVFWLNRDTEDIENFVALCDNRAFVPIIAVSASRIVKEGKRALGQLGRKISRETIQTSEMEDIDGSSTKSDDEEGRDLIIFDEASETDSDSQDQMHFNYVYVQGAGGDEEFWNRGFSSDLFWKHQEILSLSSAIECEVMIEQLVRSAQEIDTGAVLKQMNIIKVWGTGLYLGKLQSNARSAIMDTGFEKFSKVIVLWKEKNRETGVKEQSSKRVQDVYLCSKKGKYDRKHGLQNVMGYVVESIEECLGEGRNASVVEPRCLMLDNAGGGHCVGAALAWLALHCRDVPGGIMVRKQHREPRAKEGITKQRIRQIMLKLGGLCDVTEVSRDILIQLNRHFMEQERHGHVHN